MNWNFDMSAAPRDPKVKILVADPGSKPGTESVFETYWIPVRHSLSGKVLEGDRWSGFTRGREPVAWMPMPEYPFESRAKVEEEADGAIVAASDDPASREGTVCERQHAPPSGFTGARRPGGEALAAANAREPISQETANETMGGTGDDCSFGNRGAWPPQGGASSSRGNDSLSVVTAGETALHFHLILDDVGSGA